MTRLRRWFQIHLSTVVVMMLVAATILWANFSPRNPPWSERWPSQFGGNSVYYGWPADAMEEETSGLPSSEKRRIWFWDPWNGGDFYRRSGLWIDIAVGAVVVVLTATVAEATFRYFVRT